MTTANSISTNFNFRTKFKKLLNDENYSLITSAFEKFCSLDADEALEVLWRMTYSPVKAFEEVHKLGLDSQIISSENISILRNELRTQYELVIQREFTSFKTEYDDEEIQQAYLSLKNRTDSIVATVVCNYCCNAFCGSTTDVETKINRILYLLTSERDTNYFGGIRSLDFNAEEAEYLKPFHIEIHNLLDAMKDFFENGLPFYMKDDEKETKVEYAEVQEDTSSNDMHETFKNFTAVTPEQILAHKEVFKVFTENGDFNMLLPIGQLGFDLNEVMLKREEIFNFIKAAEDLTS